MNQALTEFDMVQGGGSSLHTDSNKYLSFRISDEVYAVSIMRIKEIIEYSETTPTPVPKMPKMIVGAINLRGRALPVIDLAQCLHQKSYVQTRRTCIVIVEVQANNQQLDIGVVVDAVSEVMMIDSHDIEPPPSFANTIETDFIDGMGKVDDHFVILLNIDHILSMDELSYLNNGNQRNEPLQSPPCYDEGEGEGCPA